MWKFQKIAKNREIKAMCVAHSTVWKFGNFSPTIFLQKFRQINFFTALKSYTVNQFDEKILQWGKIFEITTLCEMQV